MKRNDARTSHDTPFNFNSSTVINNRALTPACVHSPLCDVRCFKKKASCLIYAFFSRVFSARKCTAISPCEPIERSDLRRLVSNVLVKVTPWSTSTKKESTVSEGIERRTTLADRLRSVISRSRWNVHFFALFTWTFAKFRLEFPKQFIHNKLALFSCTMQSKQREKKVR